MELSETGDSAIDDMYVEYGVYSVFNTLTLKHARANGVRNHGIGAWENGRYPGSIGLVVDTEYNLAINSST